MNYRPIKKTNTMKESIPRPTLTGYSTGCFEASPNAVRVTHHKTQQTPNAPTPDSPSDIAEVFMLQCVLTVLENSKQKPEEMATLMPSKMNAIGQP